MVEPELYYEGQVEMTTHQTLLSKNTVQFLVQMF